MELDRMEQPGYQTNPAVFDEPWARRRALAAHVAVLATTIQVDRDGSRDLGVLPPRILTPRTCREWAERLEAANAMEGYHRGGPG